MSKPHKKLSDLTHASVDLDGSASVNRPTILHRHVPKPDSVTDVEAQESTQKVTRLNFQSRRKPSTEINVQEPDQETSSSINRNNIQRRILKPNQGNSLLENENGAEEATSTNRMKIRRRISKPDHVNSAADDSKVDDHDSAPSRFKVRQKYNNSSASGLIRKSGEDAKDSDGYKVGLTWSHNSLDVNFIIE